ncbi:integrase core domain-containing protein [Nocardia vinacea]|uniref:integrase core domain-containing protein n=1 Tax=Nocardia vinacea TaxID=96468 RepID=UPI003AF2961F
MHVDAEGPTFISTTARLQQDSRLYITTSLSPSGHTNPYSEALFKTLKYGPEFPDCFGSLTEARQFMDCFAGWYNHDHRHTGLGLHTPADVHYGLAAGKAADRRGVLDAARAKHPHRFATTTAPKILDLPDSVWINRPATQETDTQAA